MSHLFCKEEGQVQNNYITKVLKMDLTHNVGTFIHRIKWFSEVQLLYPKTSNDKTFGYLFSDTLKKKILCDCYFDIFKRLN